MVVLVYISFILRGTIHLNPEGIELSLPLNPNAVINAAIQMLTHTSLFKVPQDNSLLMSDVRKGITGFNRNAYTVVGQ